MSRFVRRPVRYGNLVVLAQLPDDKLRMDGLIKAVVEGWTVRETHEYVDRLLKGPLKSGLPQMNVRNWSEVIELCHTQVDDIAKEFRRIRDDDPLRIYADDLSKQNVSREAVNPLQKLAERQRAIAMEADELATHAEQRFEEALQTFQRQHAAPQPQEDSKGCVSGNDAKPLQKLPAVLVMPDDD